jgi:hypothetical protein
MHGMFFLSFFLAKNMYFIHTKEVTLRIISMNIIIQYSSYFETGIGSFRKGRDRICLFVIVQINLALTTHNLNPHFRLLIYSLEHVGKERKKGEDGRSREVSTLHTGFRSSWVVFCNCVRTCGVY